MTRRPHVLFLAHLLPWPLEGGGQIKSYYTLKLLAERYDITLYAFVRRPEEASAENLAPLKALCAGGVETVRLPRGKMRDIGIALQSILNGRSFLISRDDSKIMRGIVRNALRTGRYDVVHIDHLQMAQFVPDDAGGAKVILDQHNVEHRIWEVGTLRYDLFRLRAFELAACRRADCVLVVSEADRAALAALDPQLAVKTIVIPIGVDLDYWRVVPRGSDAVDLLTIGTMYWPPNVEGTIWFAVEILPKIRAVLPNIRLNIVGTRPLPAIRTLESAKNGIWVTGSVADVRPYAETSGVFVTPVRFGSGVRVKILNALAMGLPVVTTTIGAEGIYGAVDGVHLLIADTPEAFAAAVLRVLLDPALSSRLGANGRDLIERAYGWETVGVRLLGAYSNLLAQPTEISP